MVSETRLVGEFFRLVQISSPSKRERHVADYLKAKLTGMGLKVEEDEAGFEIGGDTGNLIARFPGNGGPAIVFCAHMDTVQPGEGIIPVLQDGIITSQGATVLGGDDKAGISAILEAIQVIKEQNLAHPEIVIVFTVAEEGGLRGAQAVDVDSFGAEFAFCLDAGGPVGSVVNRGPAQNQLRASIYGRAAHAGICPEEGVSAIQIAAEAIMRTKLGRVDSETTANIGLISGGKATNIIPDCVELEGEARSLTDAKLAAQTEHMIETLQQVARKRGGRAEVSVQAVYPAINLAEDAPVIALTIKAAQAIGVEPQVIRTGGGSDANVLNGRGLPTANLGIGMEKVHSTDEFIRVADLINLTRLLLAIVKLA
ncbi:MAG: M20/M25/M40 family metallo-hydrolase [Peptococcaceae bacterium]|nr:M20/M25/M40 family metallo-hydrolase [Peptococcaceae bacterium]